MKSRAAFTHLIGCFATAALIISNRGGHARFTDALSPTSGERIQSWLPNWDLEAGVAARTDRRLALIGHGRIVQI